MSEAPERPPRPAVPLSLWALVVALCCERLVLWHAPGRAALAALVACPLAALVLLGLLAAALPRGGLRRALPLVAVLCASASVSCGSAALELARQGALEGTLGTSAVSLWELELEGDMSEGASGWRGRASASREGEVGGEVWLVCDERLDAGARVRCVGRFTPNDEDEWGASSRAQGLAGTVRVVRVLTARPAEGLSGAVLGLRSAVLATLDPHSSDARALLAGSVCGSNEAIRARGLDEEFAVCGVAHLVAVSGGHLVVVAGVASALLYRTRLGAVPRAVALLLLTALFVAFCGAPVSAVRSWAMSLVAALSALVGRRAHPLSSASAVALGMALADPGVTGQLGYLLSVACVCGICALGGYARYLVRVLAGRPRICRCLPPAMRPAASRTLADARDALALTLVSQLVTAPLTCAAFSQLSLVAPLANVLLAPVFSAFLSCGLLAACLAWAPAAQGAALLAADATGAAFVGVMRSLASLPLASVPVSVDEGPALVALAVVIVGLLLWWPHASRAALAGLCLAVAAGVAATALCWRLLAPACVRVLDVGQGDAVLVTDGATAVLVDTGPGDAVVDALARSRVLALDAVVLTHLRADHAGGLEDVLGAVPVGRVLVGEGVDGVSVAQGLPVEELGYGDVLRAGRFTLEVVSPLEPSDGSGNEGSLELLLAFDDGRRSLVALLAADAEVEETSAAARRGDVGDVDFLKVGHHGSAASLDEATARALDPEVSVASAGEGNSYGHPDPACVEVLERVGSLFLCTMDVGDVCVEPGERGPVVSCQREGEAYVLN